MEKLTVACVQQRMRILPTHEEFEAEARRFLRQAQAKAAQVTIFPEFTGVMLAPPLISGFKLGFIKREDQGKQRGAGFLSRSLGKVSGTTAGALGGEAVAVLRHRFAGRPGHVFFPLYDSGNFRMHVYGSDPGRFGIHGPVRCDRPPRHGAFRSTVTSKKNGFHPCCGVCPWDNGHLSHCLPRRPSRNPLSDRCCGQCLVLWGR